MRMGAGRSVAAFVWGAGAMRQASTGCICGCGESLGRVWSMERGGEDFLFQTHSLALGAPSQVTGSRYNITIFIWLYGGRVGFPD